ncbi:nematocyst expressed protein 4-like [Bacillus rossius redtenbacheri]|uniref:nematocyst expressed protein 4-like n=1 Tax=Bacillus rossius redtenbacheri TaxID=93214 RepID=UPI002FDCD903
MESLKRCALLLATVAVVRCGPQSGPNNQYLPPDQQGYTYDRPSVPFPPPPQPPSPPQQQPSYPSPQPPSYPSPQPPPPPPPPPPQQQPSYPSPQPPPPQPPTGYPSGPPQPPPKTPGYPSDDASHHHDHVHMPGMPYDFNYAVKDDYHGNDFSRNEVSDGDVVQGEYRVQLPDGRLQIVTYTADWATGFHADVRYEGEAMYPPPSEYKKPSVFPPQPQQPPQQQDQSGYSYPAPPGGAVL